MILQAMPYPASVAKTGDVVIAVQDYQTGTTTGVVNYTTATLTGVTPGAALVFSTRQIVADEPAESQSAQFAVTGTDGTRGHEVRTLSADGGTSVNARRSIWLNHALARVYSTNGSAVNSQANVSLISGGISNDYNNATVNHHSFYIAFAGSDLSSNFSNIQLGTGTSAITVSPGLEPDAVIFFGVNEGTDNSSVSTFGYTFGIATSDGTQRCVMAAEDEPAADGQPFQAILTNRVSGQISDVTGDLNYHITASNFTSTSFDVTPNASAGSDRLMRLALNLGPRRCKLVDFTTPTSTGSSTISGVGFEPQFALAILTNLESTDPSFPLTTSDLMSSLSICAIGDEQWSSAIRQDSGAATIDTASTLKNTALYLLAPTGGAQVEASLTAWTSDGMTLNYTAVAGAGKKGFILFVE